MASNEEIKTTPQNTNESTEITNTTTLSSSSTRPNTDESIEKISVTGSRIKRIHLEGPSPILTLNRDDLERTGYNSIGDVLRDMPLNSFGSRREMAGHSAPGLATVDLRGLGADRTLVLLNGKRMLKDANANASDLNLVPFAAVERIEILKDSSSAVYGSDALGGVVNIITRQNFNGVEAALKQFASEGQGGNHTEVSLVSGYSTPKMNITGVAYYRNNQMIYARDRVYSNRQMSHTGSPGTLRALDFANDPYLTIDRKTGKKVTTSFSKSRPAPGCPEERILDSGDGNFVCQYNYADHASLRPTLEQASLMLDAGFNMTERLDTFLRFSHTQRDVSWLYAPTPAGMSSGFTVSAQRAGAMAQKINKSTATGQKAFNTIEGLRDIDRLGISYRLVELGNRVSEIETSQYNILTGFRVDLGETWEVETSAGHSYSYRIDRGVSGYAHKKALQKALRTSFNSLAPIGKRGQLSHLNYSTWDTASSKLALVEAAANGEVFEIPAGPISAAVGIQAHYEVFSLKSDPASADKKIIGSGGTILTADRDVVSSYIEFSAPLLSTLELSLAGRQDRYSDFGQAFSPKVALRWQASPQILVRSSIGRGFKAPNMEDLYKDGSKSYEFFIDDWLCKEKQNDTACSPQQWEVQAKGNPNLREERSLKGQIGTYTELDLQYSYSANEGGMISIGLRNLLGTWPTLDNSNPNLIELPTGPTITQSLYDGNGRVGWVQYKYSF